MGMLFDREREDYETIATEHRTYEDYHLHYDLLENTCRERILWSTDERRRQQVRVRAYEMKANAITDYDCLTEQKTTWDKDDGPHKSWEFQIESITSWVLDDLREYDEHIEDFEDAIPDCLS
jgi:hypothetical protein